jgi:SAM-dependent methyltransferase
MTLAGSITVYMRAQARHETHLGSHDLTLTLPSTRAKGISVTPAEAREWASERGLLLRYGADLHKLSAVGAPFTELSLDEGTARYIGAAEGARHGFMVTWLHRLMRGFFSDFDINGYLGTYPMHVLSTEQWRELLPEVGGRLLDVGAGRGDATSQLAALFDHTVTTETSPAMAKRLRRLGYECLLGDIAERPDLGGLYDVVSLLNVLDRCDEPLSLLATARSALRGGGLLLVALVLPYGPFVYDGGQTRSPRQRLPIVSNDFETAAAEFVTSTLFPLGLEVVTLSRAPYLSGGDAQRPIYELDDLIVVCRAIDAVPLLG